ncbi:hypothetical protein HZA87_04415 [Candidatus Uhrbacteria bacterium]|nr:hypothetical protein [Candidatus Uhrbacteria bacterium]
MDELKQELEHLGLSDKEARVYLAALELGPSPVQDISHKAHVNRATTYVMIESLASRGLMSTFQKGKRRFYVSESPDRLMSIIQVKQKELAEKELELGKVMPLLTNLYNAEGAKPQVRYLEGPEGIETVRQIFEKLPGDFIQIYPREDVLATEEFVHGRLEHMQRLRHQEGKAGVSARKLILVDDPSKLENENMGVGQVRMLPRSEFPIHGEVTVRGNHVFLFSYKSAVLACVIISHEIAEVVRAMFELAWRGAQEYPVKQSTQK